MELLRFPSRGGFSVRSIVTFVLTVVITALLWATLSSTATRAVEAGETASWQGNGSTLLFDKHGYTQTTDLTDPTGTIPAGSTIYQSPIQNSGQSSVSQRVFILFFSPGVDPPTATSATYVEFDYKDGKISNPQNKQDITVTPPGANGESGSSCSVTGIGWIICPVSNFLADAMDSMFSILAGMIAVQPPVLGDSNNSMYVAWNITRSVANIAFVIAFLIIIYSQLTNIAVSNYGLKKLIPRLIIAAILVNVSYYVAALAIDISNILGYSVQSVFNSIREQTFHLTNDNVSGLNTNTWGAVSAAVLAGGGIVGGVYFIAGGGLYLLLPVLLGLLLTIIFVVVLLAARQAIIVILVIIAPLAFVANLLPNTEKWFDKWKDTFFTMLIFFPAFSLVWGGSQLAGQIIIQNAGDNIVMLIFGMAVQIAPLVISPLLLKLSGGVLGRIAQIANNPRKGIIDRNRTWAQQRADHAKYQNIKRGARWYNPSSYGAAGVRRMDQRKRRLSESTDVWKQEATNAWEGTPEYAKIHERSAGAELDKTAIHKSHDAHIEKLKKTPGTRIHDSARNAQVQEDHAETAKNNTLAYYNEQRVRGSSALRASGYALEASKSLLEDTDTFKTAHYTDVRSTPGTILNARASGVEASKLKLETSQSRYTAMVDDMKLTPGSVLNGAATTAQSAKDHAEATQVKLQTFFDQERKAGGSLNATHVELEGAKVKAEGVKASLSEYTATLKTKGPSGTLHTEFIETERLKQVQQISDAKLAKSVDEYKSGKIDTTTLSPREATIMEQMKTDATTLYAEKQAASAAQYEVQRNITEVMSGSGPLSDQMLDIAQSVGGETARVRAQAQAVSAARRLDSEALTANVELLKGQAQVEGQTIKKYSAGIVEAVLDGDTHDSKGREITPERLKAALQAQADQKHMALFERVRGSRNFDQSMVSEIISLNEGTFKGAGGFHMQEFPEVNIDNYATDAEFDQAMRAYRVGSLANASASNMSGIKYSWLSSFANTDPRKGTTLEENIAASLATPDGEKYLRMAYTNVREALINPDIRATIGDREDEIRTIEAALANVFHVPPTPDDRPSL